jgi:VanZ family protein
LRAVWSTVALAVWAIAVVVGSVMPGRIVESWSAVMANLEAGATLAVHEPRLVTVLERLVVFFPLGWLILRATDMMSKRQGATAGFAVFLFALILELAQSLVDSRHARLTDFLLATAFGWLGVWIAAWFGRRPSPLGARGLLLASLLTGNAVVTAILVQIHLGADIKGWDCDFPLVVANESSGDRPWRGRIRGLAIYPRALDAGEVARIASVPFSSVGLHSRQDAGALVVHHFDRIHDRRVPQALPNRPELDLLLPPSGASTWRARPAALDVTGPIRIQGDRVPHELCRAIRASGAFAIEVEIASADQAQSGPARIVSYSSGPYQRNFTLAQEGGAVVFRVRTPWNGPNGANLPLESDDGALAAGWHHLVAVYGRGAARVFVDGAMTGPPIRYYQLVRLSEDRVVASALFSAIWFMLLGVIAALMKAPASWAGRARYAYVGAALVPTSVAYLLGMHLSHDPDRLLIAAAAVGPGIAVLCLKSWSWLSARWGRRNSPAPSSSRRELPC